MAKEQTSREYITKKKELGEVKIASDVVAAIAALNYGYSIPEVSGQVQERVSQQIENMTGLSVSEVNVRIAGVKLEEN